MKKSGLILLFCMVSFVVLPQEAAIKVIRYDQSGTSSWQILDENYGQVFPGYDFTKSDTATFFLEPGRRYFLSVSINDDSYEATLYTLYLNGEPLLLVSSGMGAGDHFIPFFTGVRDHEAKITGGTTASISDFPWQVYVIAGDFRCGGSIIGDRWVLTAAHCTEDDNDVQIPASSFRVRAGSSVAVNGEEYLVQEVIAHENYNNSTLANDIALLRLASPVDNPNARPIDLVTKEDALYGVTDPGVMGWVTGWGLIQVDPRVFPSSLQKVQLPIVSLAQAMQVWSRIPTTDMMVGFLNGNKDACNGDSGGPFVVNVVDELKLAGIVSWGSSKCNTYGAYTRVSLFEDWIRQKTGIGKSFVPPVPQGDSVICKGESSTQFSVPVISGASSYEWKLLPVNAGSVSGSNNSAIVSWNASYTGHATLNLRVNIDGRISDWSVIRLNVVNNTRFISQSDDTAICEGESITLGVSAEGYKLQYSWYRDGVLQQTSASNSYRILSAKPGDTGGYTVMITGECGTVFSDIIQLEVRAETNIVAITPDTQAGFGSDVELSVTAEGHNLTYEWEKDDVVINGSNDPVLSLQNLRASDIGNYSVTVSGTCGTETSRDVYLFVGGDSRAGGSDFFLWPTVTRDEFYVALSTGDYYDIYVHNSSGMVILISRNNRYKVTLDASTWPKGIYFVTIISDNIRRSLKVIRN